MCQNINLSDEKPFHIKIESKIQYAGFGKILMRAQKNRNAKKSLQIWIYWFFVREMKYQLFPTKTYCLLAGLESCENKHWKHVSHSEETVEI